MPRFFKRREELLGRRPGEMVYIGRNLSMKPRIERIIYSSSACSEKIDIGTDGLKEGSGDQNIWINVEGVSDSSIIEAVRNRFNINPLICADIMNTATRPKYLPVENGAFLSFKMLSLEDEKKIIVSEQLSLLISENSLITFQEARGDVFEPVRARLKDETARIRTEGVGYLAYSLIDSVADNYIRILQNIAEEVEDCEEDLLNHPDEKLLKRIIFLKKELLFLGKSVRPLKEAVRPLLSDDNELFKKNREFYSDLYSNLANIVETVDLYKEITAQQQNTYDTYANNRLNEIMKFLTIFSVIFLPLTLITGIYGTNFDFIPELHFRYGYLFLWGILALFSSVMIIVFKRKKWL